MRRCPDCGFRTEDKICPLCGVKTKPCADTPEPLHIHQPGETCMLTPRSTEAERYEQQTYLPQTEAPRRTPDLEQQERRTVRMVRQKKPAKEKSEADKVFWKKLGKMLFWLAVLSFFLHSCGF